MGENDDVTNDNDNAKNTRNNNAPPSSDDELFIPIINDSIQHLAQLALDLTSQDWKDLGKQQQQSLDDETNDNNKKKKNLAVAESFQDATERVVSLLLVRIVAVIMGGDQQQQQHHQQQVQLLLSQQQQQQQQQQQEEEREKSSNSKNNNTNNDGNEQEEEEEKNRRNLVQETVSKKYPSDYSTTSLCRTALSSNERDSSSSVCCWPIVETGKQEESDNNESMNDAARISTSVLNQLRNYVKVMLQGYNDLPFHNYQHCYHVVLSANKLLDLMLYVDDGTDDNSKRRRQRTSKTKTYGLRSDPMALLALMFAALIHDVGHSGVNNRQRVAELDDELAIQYNDESIHENHSLHVAFAELLQPKYDALRTCMFPDDVSYRAFRKLVIHVVLSTDLTSPERLQMSASMFQEAYPDYFDDDDDDDDEEENEPDNFDNNNNNEYVPDDYLDNDLNMDNDDPRLLDYDDEDYYDKKHQLQQSAARRSSLGSMPRAVVGKGPAWSSAESRRGSMNSVASDITMDSYTRHAKTRQVERLNAQNATKYGYGYNNNNNSNRHINNDDEDDDDEPRRYSISSSFGEYNTEEQSAGDSMLLHARNVPRTAQHSILRSDSNDSGGGGGGRKFSMGSGAYNNLNASFRSMNSANNASGSIMDSSIAAESVGLTHQRQDGKPLTRATTSPTAALRLRQSRRRGRRASGGPNAAAARAASGSNDDDDDDEDSLSLTPPSSEDEMDGFIVTGITLSKSVDQVHTSTPAKAPAQSTTILRRSKSSEEDELFVASMRSQNQQQQQSGTAGGGFRSQQQQQQQQQPIGSMRRASTGNYNPNRFGRPITGQKIVEESPGDLNDSNNNLDWSFNNKAPTNTVLPPPGYFRKRLGIRRSMDLSGESIEHYSAQSRRSSCASSSMFSGVLDGATAEGADASRDGGGIDSNDVVVDDDEPNELRSTVVIEIFLKVSDVAHWFQDWNVMIRFNGGLFRELCVAHAAGRGFDPRPSWFDNQIKAMENYVLPLADQFCHLGVLEHDVEESFATTVERNLNRWIEEGFEITQSLTLKQVEDQGDDDDDDDDAKGDEYR